MQLKNSLVLLTALTAGSSVARLHGHERRHAHHEKRDVGDLVTAIIDGKVVSWVNEYAGGAAATATAAESTSTSLSETVAASTTASSTETPSASAVSSASGTCANWDDESDEYSTAGFGSRTVSNLAKYVAYIGNIGNPWGSNIIEVDADKACKYKNVVKFSGSETDDWTIVFWNKIGPDGKLTGWYGNSALKLTIAPGETKYVAFDDDSQGAWGAAKGDSLPTDEYGGYSCTWGEFDFANSGNNDWSGWDVSAIQAQAADQDVQGMKICNNKGEKCSWISNLATAMENAYSKAEEGVDGIGGNQSPGAVRLVVDIDYTHSS
ncbi:allergen Asp F4 [Aspergillus foveolatus]|uniref:allergen Asp F4 n=1 Tax=Aspergillus foveolatus TaxID=210207 RepID=UPI003CCDA389